MNEELQMDEAEVSRILHYVLLIDGRVICRPGIVIQDNGKGFVDLEVFGLGDRSIKTCHANHKTKELRSWHWPRACKSLPNE